MISIKQKVSRGFTIVELLIVIVVIGILAALVIVTYNGIQAKARDTERKTDINAVASHLEAYFAQNAKYPCLNVVTATCATGANGFDLNDTDFRSTSMKGLDSAALADPNNSTTQAMVGTPTANRYSYEATPAGCDNASNGDCTKYVLTAKLETGSDYVKNSLN